MPIQRHITATALDRLRKRPVTAILGARQVGKTTLSHQLVKKLGRPSFRLDLEDPDDQAMLRNAKEFLLAHTDELVVIDEVQRMPGLFPLLRTLVDRDRRPGRYLLLGSSSPAIVQQASESLAGRVAYLDLYPLSVHEVARTHQDRLWLRGGYPDAFLAESDADAFDVLRDLLRSFTERDLPQLGLQAKPANALQLLRMLASTHGSVLNMAMLARSIGLSAPTVKHYLHFFEAAYFCFALPSYQANLRKRLMRAPKVYLTDSGVLHALLNVRSHDDLFGHHLRGPSWEGFVVQQVRAWLEGRAELGHFRTQDGSELDLVVLQGDKVVAAVEIKTSNHPDLSKGNMLAFDAVKAPLRLVVTPGAKDHPYGQGITVCSLATLWAHLGAV
ncbi:MAG: ATP-binding protein, partial [Flavobacteriales bacterium]|nr:ATP-binding protein [Flavobacteriales bacterium]